MQLFEWGLRPETAVGCALNYLFKPRPEVLELVHENFKALRNPDALKIGIQVQSVNEMKNLYCRTLGTCVMHHACKACHAWH